MKIRFIDTNVLVYAFDLDAPKKRGIASAIMDRVAAAPSTYCISTQVLQEFTVNLLKRGVPSEEMSSLVADLAHLPVVACTTPVLQQAIAEHARWKISFWDAMILAAARAAGATELLSEDFNPGQNYGGIRATNPFAALA